MGEGHGRTMRVARKRVELIQYTPQLSKTNLIGSFCLLTLHYRLVLEKDSSLVQVPGLACFAYEEE